MSFPEILIIDWSKTVAYEKLTADGFKQRLNSGEYDGVAGARRSLGRVKMGDDERAKLNKLVDKHFDAAPQGAKAPKAAKATKAPKAAKVAVKAAVKAATKPAAVATPVVEGKKRGRKPKVHAAATAAEVVDTLPQRVAVAQAQVGTITDAIKAIKMCKEMNPNLDNEKLAQGTKDGSEALVRILNDIRADLGVPSSAANGTSRPADPAIVAALRATVPVQPFSPNDADVA